MPLSSFILLFLTFISAAAGTPKHLRCLPSGDESAINQAVANGAFSAYSI